MVIKKILCQTFEGNINLFNKKESNLIFEEMLIFKKLNHYNLVKYEDIFLDTDENGEEFYVCVVMEYYPEGDLHKWMKKNQIDQEIFVKFAKQLNSLLTYLQENKLVIF